MRSKTAGAIKYRGEFAKLNFPKEIERSPKRLNLRLANWLGARLNFPEDVSRPERSRRARLNFPQNLAPQFIGGLLVVLFLNSGRRRFPKWRLSKSS